MNTKHRLRLPVRHRTRRGLIAVGAVLALVAAPQSAFASVSVTPDATPKVNGKVLSVAQVGTRTIIGGLFTEVGGKPRLNVAAIREDGTLDPNFNPTVNGEVWAIAGSEDGSRVFLGGLFSTVGGTPRANLAAVDAASGAVVADWQADTTGTQPNVAALAVSGPRVYVAGRYSGIDGTTRKRLVALGVDDGDVVTAFKPAPDGILKGVKVSSDGSKVYAGGSFVTIGGQPRPNGAAELLASTGEATAFAPSLGGGKVTAVGLSPDDSRMYFGTENNTLFAYDLTSNLPAWSIKASGNTQSIAVSPTEVYIGGHFSQIVTGKIPRMFIASLNPGDGSVTAWDPKMTGGSKGVWALAITPTHLIAGGVFATIGGVKHKYFARFSGTP